MAPPSSSNGPPMRMKPAVMPSMNRACSSHSGCSRVPFVRSRCGPATESTTKVELIPNPLFLQITFAHFHFAWYSVAHDDHVYHLKVAAIQLSAHSSGGVAHAGYSNSMASALSEVTCRCGR